MKPVPQQDKRRNLFRGLGPHFVGRSGLASEAFETAIGLMEPAERERFLGTTSLHEPEPRSVYQ